jgi:hypothetical protein
VHTTLSKSKYHDAKLYFLRELISRKRGKVFEGEGGECGGISYLCGAKRGVGSGKKVK